MSPPTLEQVLNFFRDHPLPANPEAPYNTVTVSGLPVCGPDDSPSYRMLGYPNNPNGIFYLPPNQVSPQAPFPNPDDALLRRVLTGTGGLVYQREGRGQGGARVPLGMGSLHLCRSASPVGNSGRYTVSVSDNAVINNQPGNPAPLRRVNFAFTQPEIEAIVHGLRRADGTIFTLAGDHYQVDASNHSQLSLMPDRNELEQIIALIRANGSAAIPAGPRREDMIGRLQDFIRTEAAQGQVLDEQLRWPPWKIALYSILASVLPSIGIMYWMQQRNERLMREMQQGPKINIGELFEDPTDSMRSRDRVTVPESQRRYVEAIRSRFNQGSFPHVVLSGPSGSGKSFTADLIGKLAVNGQLGVEAFQGQDVHFVRIDAKEIVRSAGSWQNGAQARFFEVLNQLTKDHTGPIIIHLLEADKFAAAGQGPGNQPLNLLKELYTIMEGMNPQYRNVHFILDSTRWQTIQEAAPDMLRRAQFMEIIPTTPEDLRSAVENGIRTRRTSHKDDRIRARFERITFSPDALDAITALGEYRDGAPPSSHLDLVDKLAEQASQHTTGNLVISREHVLRYIARDRGKPITEVRDLLTQRLGTEGIRNNPRIQAAIMEGFYRAYPQPMRGQVNPMQLAAVADANPVSIFEDSANHDAPPTDTNPRPRATTGTGNPGAATVVDGPVVRSADFRPGDVSNTATDAIVRAQILQRYPHFLSQGGREALQDNQPLPTEGAIASEYRTEVNALVTRVMAQYALRMDPNNPNPSERANMERLWADEARDNGFVARRGVPDGFLRDIVDRYIADQATRPASPFNGNTGSFRPADRLDAAEFERHMDLLRHIGR